MSLAIALFIKHSAKRCDAGFVEDVQIELHQAVITAKIYSAILRLFAENIGYDTKNPRLAVQDGVMVVPDALFGFPAESAGAENGGIGFLEL